MANHLGSGGGILIDVHVAHETDGAQKITFLIADNDVGLFFLSYGLPTLPPFCKQPPEDPKAWLGQSVFYGPASHLVYTNPWYPEAEIAKLRKVAPSVKKCIE